MLNVAVHITGLDNAQARMAAIGERLMDFTGALTSLAAKMTLFYEDTNFNSEGAALGTPWVPLKSKTEDEKLKKWPGRGMLERTGTMRKGFTSDITPQSLFISNDVPYFPYHQLGTGYGGKVSFGIGGGGGQHIGRGRNLPARKMLGINTEIEDLIRTEIEADVRAKIDSVG